MSPEGELVTRLRQPGQSVREYDPTMAVDTDPTSPQSKGTLTCHVVDDRGSGKIRFDRQSTGELLARGRFFWLDLDRPNTEDFAVLRDVFGFHPLALADSEDFGQRPMI